MAPRGRLLDLEKEDVLFFYGAYHQSDGAACSVARATTHAIVFWPVFLVAALLLHLMAPFPHAAAVCGALYVGYCFFLLDRAAQATTAAVRSTTRGRVAGYTIEQKSQ